MAGATGVSAIITRVAAIQEAIPGIKKAHINAPESIKEMPCFVNFPASADIEMLPMQRRVKHLIKMHLFVQRSDLPSAEKELRPFLELVFSAFDADITLGGTVIRSYIIHYDYGKLEYPEGTKYAGDTFDLEVLERDTTGFS